MFPMGQGFVCSKRGWWISVAFEPTLIQERGARTVCLGQNAGQKHREDTASCFDFAGGRKILHPLSEVFERIGEMLGAEKAVRSFRSNSRKRLWPVSQRLALA